MSASITPADGVWTMELLLAAEVQGETPKFLAFWGHTPSHGGAVGPHVFSQWYAHPFAHEGTTYASAEHFMMAGKARLFGDGERLEQILAARTPAEAKNLGRLVRGFDEAAWAAACVEIVRQGSIAKFASAPELRDYLVGTGTRVLVEASPIDRIWGIGAAHDDPSVTRPSEWRGQNLLGFALMQARAALASR